MSSSRYPPSSLASLPKPVDRIPASPMLPLAPSSNLPDSHFSVPLSGTGGPPNAFTYISPDPTPNPTDIVDYIWLWILKNPELHKQIKRIHDTQAGGWEGWAQVEIADLVIVHYTNVKINREVNVYLNSKKRNDFLITDTFGLARNQIIELKCERQSQGPEDFWKEFDKDIEKIKELKIEPKYLPARLYAVAIVCTEDTNTLLERKTKEFRNLRAASLPGTSSSSVSSSSALFPSTSAYSSAIWIYWYYVYKSL